MTLLEQYIPAPYPFMYLDGYTPYEILQATSRKLCQDYQAKREDAQAEKDIQKSIKNAIDIAMKDLLKDWK